MIQATVEATAKAAGPEPPVATAVSPIFRGPDTRSKDELLQATRVSARDLCIPQSLNGFSSVERNG